MNNYINIPEYEVSQFNQLFKKIIESNFDYVRIKGEISEIKVATKGQLYLTLKDDNSILSGVIWDNKKKSLQINPEQGMEVIVTGKITTWSKYKTTYQIDIDRVEIAGEGALLKLIEDRKKKLKNKGFFDDKYKKGIPYFPNKIGVITSPTGSVIHDIINRIKDRFPLCIEIWPVPVQGINAANNIIEAIRGFNSDIYKFKPDIIIIARGGGSIEDLMVFNDERLAEAVFQSKIPIISAIGHETDTTIIDYVSDFRASTPTAAAEIAVPLMSELEQSVKILSKRLDLANNNNYVHFHQNLVNLSRAIKSPKFIINSFKEKFKFINNNFLKELINLLNSKKGKLKNYSQLVRSPKNNLMIKKEKLNVSKKNLEKYIDSKIIAQKTELKNFVRLLILNSVDLILDKGYSIIRKSNKIIKYSAKIQNQDLINVQFSDKIIKIKVKKIN